jgi:GTP:adenosylcobinamide-phosphate guanylyltransferase
MLNVIVQAGGRGSRLRHHTWNKPKCLVSVQGKPMLYHAFEKFPDARFWIIADYGHDQLKNYLDINDPGVELTLIRTDQKGTCSGIDQALEQIPSTEPVLLIWSDLIISDIEIPSAAEKPVIYTTSAFTCRWSLNSGNQLTETPSTSSGIPGIFYFSQKSEFPVPPSSGEFVKWLSQNLDSFDVMHCDTLSELGDFSSIEEENDRAGFSRFFNQVTILESTVSKSSKLPEYQHLIEKEQHWYQAVSELGFRRIPRIISTNPFVMERISGHHAYQVSDYSTREKRAVLADYIYSLQNLHDLASVPSVQEDIVQVYLKKTQSRVSSVSALIPNFHSSAVTVNGKKCRNVFSEKHQNILPELMDILIPEQFVPIHGDPTFSNSLIDQNLKVQYIDPRGYFHNQGIWGDARYDYAKVYYSALGGYDSFNRRKFKLHVDPETVEILQETPEFSTVADEVFQEFFGADLARIQIIHGLIWLGLSGYVRDDIDSIIGSFYLGLYWLEKGLEKI